jgi:tRNA-splicing ligase RtcB (3'-phosphate/5'-hydroxy nucleic acid ligase)
MSEPININGKDLIDAGVRPGPGFGQALKTAQEQLAAGSGLQEVLAHARKAMEPTETVKIPLRKSPLPIEIAAEPQGEEEEKNIAAALEKIREVTLCPIVERAALMPDTCPAGSETACIPVGGAIQTTGAILPGCHSADICCSMSATFFDSREPLSALLGHLEASTLFGPWARKPGEEMNHPVLEENVWDNPFLRGLDGHAHRYLGTQGDGNHFASIGSIEGDAALEMAAELEAAGHEELARPLTEAARAGRTLRVLITHHGSRNLGAQIYKRGIEAAVAETAKIAHGIPKQAAWLDLSTDKGKTYWEALAYAGRWTKANHEVIHASFLEKAKAHKVCSVGNEHNFVWEAGGKILHGKGATPAWKDELGRPKVGIIPLNMGASILLVLGGDNTKFLSFAPHGAGRNKSRSETMREFKDASGKIDQGRLKKALAEATSDKGLDIRWGSGKPDITESPLGYKDAATIKRQIEGFGLARVAGEITPGGCIMAGEIEAPWMKKKREARALKEAAREI